MALQRDFQRDERHFKGKKRYVLYHYLKRGKLTISSYLYLHYGNGVVANISLFYYLTVSIVTTLSVM